jgi:apolipoprotein N-acyltransferase
VASAPARTQEVLVETVGLSTTTTPAVRLGVWPARLALIFLVLHTAAVAVTYRRRRSGNRADHPPLHPVEPLERGTPA